MSTRELVFNYRTRGAKSAAKADEKVRKSVSRTGRTAQRNAGEVERWMARNKTAITAVATATAAGIASILSLSPTLRAQFAGVRAGFTLFADTIVRDVLPAGRSLGQWVLNAVMWYRDLDDSIRRPISAIITFAGILAGVIATVAAFAKVVLGAASVLAPVASALLTVATGIAAFIAGLSATTIAIAALVAAVVALSVALIFNIGNARERVLEILGVMVAGMSDLLGRAHTRAREVAAGIRDFVVSRIGAMRDRVLEILDIAGEWAAAGRDWIGGMIDGVNDRVSELVGAFRNMASSSAQAFRDEFNRVIPSSVQIPRVRISIPSVLGGGSVGVGGQSIDIPQLNTGGRITGDGLAMLHAGEKVVPAAQVRDRGEQSLGGGKTIVENVTIMVESTGDAARDGQSIARQFEQELGNRGA